MRPPVPIGIEHDSRGARIVYRYQHPSGGKLHREPIAHRPNWPAVAVGVALVWLGTALGLSGQLDGANLIGGPLLMGAGGWVVIRQAIRAGVRW